MKFIFQKMDNKYIHFKLKKFIFFLESELYIYFINEIDK